ncbi:YhgE/Pip family protein [Naasia aerilata]
MLVPLLYGGLYLWANRDPYAALDRVPAALVVQDEGTTVDGRQVTYGADIATSIEKDATFDWSTVSASAAARGVQNGTYDFSITLPVDFSANLASAATDSPDQGLVVLRTNDTNSYLATTIAGQAAEKIRAQIARQVGEEAADRFLLGFSDIRSSLTDAAAGAGSLASGAADAADGAAALRDGTASVATGASSLQDGLDQLSAGAAALPGSTVTLAAGARSTSDGAAALSVGASRLAASSAAVTGGYSQARGALEQQLLAAGTPQAQVDALLAGLDQYGASVSALNEGVQSLAAQAPALADGSAQVADGAQQLADAAPGLADGIASADAGAASLTTGAQQAADGASSLSAGTDQVAAGVAQLRDSLQKGAGDIPATTDSQRSVQASAVADPVAVETQAVTKATDYGAGLAPFFLTLAAWIGIYALFLIVKPLSRRAITALASPWKVTLAGWLTPGLLGVVQAATLFVLTTTVLGFGVASPAPMLAFMALTSLTFAAILLALNALLGSVGQFLGLVLMVVQLVTAAGTFPWQTLPGPLAALHHVLPMSYGVDGLRQLMYGGSGATALGDAAVLLGWLLVALAATLLTTGRMTRARTLRDLRPSLIG